MQKLETCQLVNLLTHNMPQIKPDIESFASIKVVGVGGSGGNAVSRMMEVGIKGVDFIAINTDAQDLHHCYATEKLHIGKNITKGLGAGMDPELGRQAAEEAREEIEKSLEGADMVFITCGLGGGTGTGASPIIAEVAKASGALTVAVVTRPFAFEGVQRSQIAREGLDELQGRIDTVITIPNDRLLNVIDKKTTLAEAFLKIDDVLRQAVQGIAELITIPGIINVDFADVRAVMEDAGSALMGIGVASGDERAIKAAKKAINSPLLELSIDGAQGVLFNVTGGEDLTMAEVNKAAQVITENIDPEAKVIFGAVQDNNLKKGCLKITVIATGFGGNVSGERVKEVREIYQVRPSRPGAIFKEKEKEEEGEEQKPRELMRLGREPEERPEEKSGFEMESRPIQSKEEEGFEIPAFIRKKLKEEK